MPPWPAVFPVAELHGGAACPVPRWQCCAPRVGWTLPAVRSHFLLLYVVRPLSLGHGPLARRLARRLLTCSSAIPAFIFFFFALPFDPSAAFSRRRPQRLCQRGAVLFRCNPLSCVCLSYRICFFFFFLLVLSLAINSFFLFHSQRASQAVQCSCGLPPPFLCPPCTSGGIVSSPGQAPAVRKIGRAHV